MRRQHRFAHVPTKGQLIADKWRVDRTLGVGGMGVVLAATNVRLRTKVAIKVLAAESATTPMRVTRFQREARAASALKGEHVTRVLDVGTLPDGGAYLVMEYLEGENLRKLLAKRCLPRVTCVELVLQAMEAIAEAHQQGIVHRDIKPANLFVTRRADGSPWIKVLDFGLSKITNDPNPITNTSALLGSPLYMAPEQLSSSKNADTRSDIWSLGIVLFEMLSQETPFAGETLYEVVGATLYSQPRRLRDVMLDAPAGLDAALARCLTKDPRERFQTLAEMATALAPFGGPRAAASAQYIRQLGRGNAVEVQQHFDDDIYPMIVPDDEAETLVAAPSIPNPHPPSTSIAPVSLSSRALPARSSHAFASWVTMAGMLCLAIGGAAACLVVRTPLKEQAHVGATLDDSLLPDPEQPPAEKPAERATLTRVTLAPLSDALPSDRQFLRRPSPPQLATRY